MAGFDRDDRGDGDDQYDEAIMQLTKQSYTHLLVGILLTFLLVGAVIGGLITLVGSMQKIDELLAIKPENRAEAIGKDIEQTQAQVAKAYADYKAEMEDESIYAVKKKFAVIYEMSKEAEQQYSLLLSEYQTAMYQVASRTRGSGEWYFYYEKDLRQLVTHQRQREQFLSAYLSKKQ